MDYIELLSMLVGTVIGGLITLLTARYTLKKQFESETKRMILQEKKDEIMALNSVEKEITFNIVALKKLKEVMNAEKTNYMDINTILKKDKWDKHSDTIEMIDDIEFLGRLQGFYLNLSHEIAMKAVNMERTEFLINRGFGLTKKIESYIEEYKKEM